MRHTCASRLTAHHSALFTLGSVQSGLGFYATDRAVAGAAQVRQNGQHSQSCHDSQSRSRCSGKFGVWVKHHSYPAAQTFAKCARPDSGSGQLGDWICTARCLMHHTGVNAPGG
jgi:hypothetical protein